MQYFPTSERQYLTTDLEMVDRICWNYYGFLKGTVEAVLARNPWISVYPARLPKGLLLTLPVVEKNTLTNEVELWNYAKPLKDGSAATTAVTVARTAILLPLKDDCRCDVDPPIIENPEWVTVWYFNGTKFCLGRARRESVVSGYGGGYSISGAVTEIDSDALVAIF